MSKVFSLLLTLVGFWAGNKITWQVRTDYLAGREPSVIIDRCLHDLTADPTHLSFELIDLAGGLGLVLTGLLIWLYNNATKSMRRQNVEHGSAKWARPSDIKPFQDRHKANSLLFTQTEALSLDSRKTQRNLNVLGIGSSGSGKTRYYVLPNIANASTSLVITDPKGEIYRASADSLRQRGYQVRQLNLIDFANSDTFNPLRYFNPDQAEVGCTILTENFIANTTGKKPATGQDFWEKAERALLNALISYIYFTKGTQGTLIDVVDLLAKMSASEEDETARSEVDLIFEALNELVSELDQADPARFTADASQLHSGLRFAAAQYNTYTQGAGETKKSVIISLGVRMAPLHMGQLRRLLSSDTIGLDRIGQEKTALFTIIPDTHAAFNFIVSIFYEQLFETNLYIADHKDTGRLPIMVQCFMDEFANIGRIPSFERKIAVMRSRGLSVSILIQNFAQGKAIYKDDWETIVGNCDSFLFLGGNENSTTKYVSELLGKQTIMGTDNSRSKGRNGSFSTSDRRLGRELLTPDEIGRLPASQCIYVLRGVSPFLSRKLPSPRF
ncbi:VirD4-like conjugal transfer protein, CD1115 family [Trueperella pyogenes]